MTKSDLVRKLAETKGLSFHIAESIVFELFCSMTDTLLAGKRVEIRGFGSFEIREYPGHIGRNPKTGVEKIIAPKKSPFFKTGKVLKERINNNNAKS